jgi:hypothetical protein
VICILPLLCRSLRQVHRPDKLNETFIRKNKAQHGFWTVNNAGEKQVVLLGIWSQPGTSSARPPKPFGEGGKTGKVLDAYTLTRI